MNVLICPDSFKGTYSAREISDFIEEGIKLVFPNSKITKIPMADGGEGTIDAIGGKIYTTKVRNPLGKPITAKFSIKDNTAIIESAQAIGVSLIKKPNPMLTTSYGLGELILAALDKNPQKIIITLGGSSTNDAGIGMAQALGVRFLDKTNSEIKFRINEGYSGGSLKFLEYIDIAKLDKRIITTNFGVACDVTNPLHGPNGAAMIYAPQKGANPQQATNLDSWLKNFSNIVKRDLNKNVNIPRAGASGGLGGGIAAFLNGKLNSGIDLIISETDLEYHVRYSDLIITGEGCLDSQSINDKAAIGIANLAKKYNKKIIAICGSLGKDSNKCIKHFDKIINVSDNKPSNIKKTRELIILKIKNETQDICNE